MKTYQEAFAEWNRIALELSARGKRIDDSIHAKGCDSFGRRGRGGIRQRLADWKQNGGVK